MRSSPLLLLALACACGEAYVPEAVRAPDGEGEGEGEPGEGEGEAGEGEGEAAGEGEGEGEGEPDGPARYRTGRDHAPITPFVVERWRAFRAAHGERSEGALAKVGDSLTVSTSYLRCFDGANVDLGGRALDDTVGQLSGSWARESESAVVGWSAFAPLDGSPTPLDVEVAATNPAFATVMFGTNDIQFGDIDRYAGDMLALTDALLARGVLPVLSTIPPRDDSATADAQVPRYGLVVRAIAEARQVPFLDLEPRLRALPGHGIGPDNLHLEQDARGACVLDGDGLTHGYNVRNLMVLEALDRVRRVVVDGEAAPDPDDAPRVGAGTAADPFVIDALPFTDVRDTTAAASAVDTYPACGPQDESGPELVYALVLDAPARVHALVLDRGGTDVDIHHVDASGACTARSDREIVVDLGAGTHTFVADTFGGAAQAGEMVLVVYAD